MLDYPMIVTRFAPSPTGYLHLGHAFAALTASRAGERFLLRIEDLDKARARAKRHIRRWDRMVRCIPAPAAAFHLPNATRAGPKALPMRCGWMPPKRPRRQEN